MIKQGDCFERPHFIMVNLKIGIAYSEQSPLPEGDRWCRILSLVQDWIAGARLVVVGLVVAGAGLVAAVLGLIVADAGRWSLVLDLQLLVQVW